MNAVDIGEFVPLIHFAGIDRDTTIDFASRRANQTIQELSSRLSCLANTLFCLLPCGVCCSGIEVRPSEDVIVSRWSITTDVLRQPGVYCFNPFGLMTKSVSMAGYRMPINNLKVNDAAGMPLFVSANLHYQIVDSLAATYLAKDSENFMYKQAKTVLAQIIAQHQYDTADGKSSLLKKPQMMESLLKRTLSSRVEQVGIQINNFKLTNIAYDDALQKVFLAKQEAIAYINGRKVVAEAACELVKEAVDNLKKKNILLDDTQKNQLVSDLIYMICNHGDMALRINENNS